MGQETIDFSVQYQVLVVGLVIGGDVNHRTPHDFKNHTQKMKVNLSIYCVFQNAFSIYGGLSR